MTKPIITLTSDFGVQSQGVGIMEGVIVSINPDARLIHLMHGLPDFDIRAGARTMETVINLPVGYHVCVVDPGVGTKRRPLIIQTKRGDYLIGPDNGVLLPATVLLGGATKVVAITNSDYMRQPVSAIFHGRDIFSPAAAHLSKGVPIALFGSEILLDSLVTPPYIEAILTDNVLNAEVIHVNKYGSVHLNILHAEWDAFSVAQGQMVRVSFGGVQIEVPVAQTFGEVGVGEAVILKDDYGRVEVAINQGNFRDQYKMKIGDVCKIEKIS